MKRITAALTALTVVIGLGTSCQKEMESRQEISGNGTGLKVTATIADNGTKVSYQEDGTTPNPGLKPNWQKNDIIIGFDGNDDSKTYGYKVTEVNDGVATLAKITEDNVDKGEYKGSSTSDPADGTTMYMFYAPGKKPADINSKSLTVSIASQAKEVVPTLMMAQATVANGSLSLSFTNKTAIIGVKAPTMQGKSKQYTSLSLTGSVGLNTEVKFDLNGGNLQASYKTSGTLTKALDFTSDSDGKGPAVIYIVACPATQQDLSFKFNGTEEYFNVKDVAILEGNYYRLETPNTAKQKFTVTVAEDITGGTITTSPDGSVAWGTEVTVTASPSDGYELDGSIAVNGATSCNSIPVTDNKFTMPQEAVTVSGSFKKKDYDITATGTETSGTYAVTGGTYTVKNSSDTDVTTAQIGDVITVTPSPAAGYSGGTVTVNKTGTEETVTFNTSSNTFEMPAAPVTITVAFTHDTYTITPNITPASSGSVTFKKSGSDDGITQAFYGDEITVVDTPADGYELESIKWKEEGDTDADITSMKKFTMPAKAVTVTVTFKKKVYSFTVGSSTKVVFAPGNLYAKLSSSTASDWTWGFYDKQYKFHPASMEKISTSGGSRTAASGDTEIDLFCWGYSSNSTNYNDQSTNNDFTDWGTSNLGLSSAPYSGGWRTLSKDEWSYLLNTRTTNCIFGSTTSTSARYLKCKVKDVTVKGDTELDVYGLMIFPDTFTWPATVTAPSDTYVNDNDLAWDSVGYYSATDFAALEGSGVVFLPAAGLRNGTSVGDVGSNGDYWSSTAGSSADAYYLTFNGSSVSPAYYYHRNDGRSVRLVSVVQ